MIKKIILVVFLVITIINIVLIFSNIQKPVIVKNDYSDRINNIKEDIKLQERKKEEKIKELVEGARDKNSIKDKLLKEANKCNVFISSYSEVETISYKKLHAIQISLVLSSNLTEFKKFLEKINESLKIVKNSIYLEIDEKDIKLKMEVIYD